MTTQEQILSSIAAAKENIGTTWPLYSFVTSNPLSGYEKLPFEDAVVEASKVLNATSYPSAEIYRQALANNDIDSAVLTAILKEHHFLAPAETYLSQMSQNENESTKPAKSKLDVIMAKWLAAFLDEGLAEWEMPNKKDGFYTAWKKLAKYDTSLGKKKLSHLPKTSLEALTDVLAATDASNYTALFAAHIGALPGWTGYIKHRKDTNSIWQQEFPINIEDYLAVRLTIAHHLGLPLEVPAKKEEDKAINKLKHLWLNAWEKTFQNRLVTNLDNNKKLHNLVSAVGTNMPDAQMVFCIDTRSEMIRRHVENAGNYETFGYAGFFGIAADYQHYQEDITIKSCPPIVGSPYKITENPVQELAKENTTFKTDKKVGKSQLHILKRLKNMLPSSFGFVEGAGVAYGISLLAKTFFPKQTHILKNRKKVAYESFCEPTISYNNESANTIALDEKIAIVKSGFDLMGWEQFAPVVLFIGHGSHTANNPFGSSLDCGACAASPGRHNARLLASLANDKEVRAALKMVHQIDIPENTIFVGGEHNTTTDEIVLFNAHVPSLHEEKIAAVKIDLHTARKTATAERLLMDTGSVEAAQQKSLNWGETRPEWGLAKNAAFIVGERSLTANMNLEGRCFMHSYNWQLDKDGSALAGIMGGPMVVTQWINNHYYFSTVDNETFGGGSKITHNITGQFGVVQGNGGDLKMGLPLQSLRVSDTEMYHQPLRLTTIINAPLSRVEAILKNNAHLQTLLDNEWMYLKVMDSDDDYRFKTYTKNFIWQLDRKDINRTKVKPSEILELTE